MDSQVKDSRFSVWPRIVELPLLTCSGQTLLSLFSYFDEDGKDHNYERICLAFVVRVDINNYCTIQYNTIQYNTIQCNTIQYNTIRYRTLPQGLLWPCAGPKPR